MNDDMTKIADHLLLKAPHMKDIGLFHGKMGIAVTLYMYSARYADEYMGEFAWELFQQVYDGVHSDMSVGLENGLSGIGYGTTLLKRHGLLDGDLNDVLVEIDRKIMERDPRRMTDLSIRTGAGGIMLYLDLRRRTEGKLRSFDPGYLHELAVTGSEYDGTLPDILNILHEPDSPLSDYIDGPLGIDGGIAYHLIKSCMS